MEGPNTVHLLCCLLAFVFASNGAKLRGVANEICVDQLNGAVLPHPTDCTTYFTCNFNIAFEKQCESGYWFDPSDAKCNLDILNCAHTQEASATVFDESVDSRDDDFLSSENVEELITDDSAEERTTLIETVSTTESTLTDDTSHWSWPAPHIPTTLVPTNTLTTINPDIEPNIQCPSDDTPFITFISSRSSCSKYYQCYHTKPVVFNCVKGYHWSTGQQECILEKDSDCKIEKPSVYPKCPASGHAFMPHPEACEYFLFCFNGVQSIQRCPAFYQWDHLHEKCDKVPRNKCRRG